MGKDAASSTVVIVIRVWLEDHPDFPLRAVITATLAEGPAQQVTTTTAKTIPEVCNAIEAILVGRWPDRSDGRV